MPIIMYPLWHPLRLKINKILFQIKLKINFVGPFRAGNVLHGYPACHHNSLLTNNR